MKPLINFASEPFRNRRLFWLVLGMVIIGASLVGLNSLGSKAQLEQQIAVLEPKVKALEAKNKDREEVDFSGSTLTIAQNQALIVAQDLIAKKGFSWSQLLNDLEQHVPLTVRVTRIAVNKVGKSKSGDGKSVLLSFDVVGKQATSVTQMISDLNKSTWFTAYPVSQKTIEGTDEVEFQLEVEYKPPQSYSGNTAEKTQVASQSGGAK